MKAISGSFQRTGRATNTGTRSYSMRSLTSPLSRSDPRRRSNAPLFFFPMPAGIEGGPLRRAIADAGSIPQTRPARWKEPDSTSRRRCTVPRLPRSSTHSNYLAQRTDCKRAEFCARKSRAGRERRKQLENALTPELH